MRLPSARAGGLLALSAVVAILPFFLPNNFYYDVAIKLGLSAIVCVGLNLLIGYAGQISLGHAGFFGLGAYVSAILSETYGWPPLAGLLVGATGVGLLAFVVARPILQLKGHYLAMATLGLGIIISIALNQELELTGGPDGMSVPPLSVLGWEVGGFSTAGASLLGAPAPDLAFSHEQVWYALVGVMLIASVWLALNLIDSPLGRAFRSVHGSEVAAEVVGVDTARCKVQVFVVSAILASVAGSLFAHYSVFLTPDEASFFRSIELVTMVVLGGMASIYGAVVGAAILTALPQVIAGFEEYEMMIFGLILMLTMIFMPRGLVPTATAMLRRIRP
jgi:branched-chain amino acid transport system permease protein